MRKDELRKMVVKLIPEGNISDEASSVTPELIAYIKYSDVCLFRDSLLKQQIRLAKIEENKRSIEMFLSLPESDFSDLDIADILRRRNSELEKEK